MTALERHLGRMLRSLAWADRRLLDALRATPAAHAGALPLCAHVLAAEHVWLARIAGHPPEHPVFPQLDLEACFALAEQNEQAFELVADRGEAELQRVVSYQNTAGRRFKTSVADVLTHVVIHGAHHRGQIASALVRAGATAPATDYVVFAREVEPLA